MLPIDRIQQALKGIDQASFQKLCDEYHCKVLDVKEIRSRGSVAGSAKTKTGQPDTLITLRSGKYVMVEATTQTKGLTTKLLADLEECFNEKETGVSLQEVEKIVMACNRNLSEPVRKSLQERGREKGCVVEFLELDSLSHAIKAKFPILAKEYLHIALDTGQILTPDDFVKDYEKGRSTTPLSNEFFFRSSEKEEVLNTLERIDLIFLIGKAGVGKTKLALECAKEWVSRNEDYSVFCIGNKNRDLYENLRLFFGDDGNYLIIVDDANRLNAQFGYILELLKENDSEKKIKIIATVRDYAVQHVRSSAREYESKEIVIQPFSDEEIIELLDKGFEIRHRDFTSRVCSFSSGNARLAVMAAEVINREGDLGSIRDVSGLYDKYFESITDDLKYLGEKESLKIAGIISYFRTLDRTNTGLFESIAVSFGFTVNELWHGLEKLHEFEIVDIDFEVAKVSDQILGTYLFYKSFFKEEVVDFSVLLHKPFERLLYLLSDSLFPAWEAFDTEFIRGKLKPHILKRWSEIKENEPEALAFAERFHFVAEAEFLVYLKERIESLPRTEIDESTLKFESLNNQSISDPYLAVLRRIKSDSISIVLDLIFRRLEKDVNLVDQVIHLLTEDFCFDHRAHQWDYFIQESVVSKLIELSKTERGDLYERLLLSVSAKYLQMVFRSNTSKGMKVTIYTTPLRPRPVIQKVRGWIWHILIEFYNRGRHQREVIAVLKKYGRGGYRDSVVPEVAADDAATLMPFLDCLDNDQYEECVLVHDFCDYFERAGVVYDQSIRSKFTNETFEIAQVLTRNDRKELKLDWKELEEHKRQVLSDYFRSYGPDDYSRLFEHCEEIQSHSDNGRNDWLFMGSLSTVLTNLADADSELFFDVLKRLFESGNRIGIRPDFIVHKIVEKSSDLGESYQEIENQAFIYRGNWLLNFIRRLPPASASEYFIGQIYDLYRTVPLAEIPHTFEFLEKFEAMDQNVFLNIVRILFDRVAGSGEAFSFRYLLNFDGVADRLGDIFAKDLVLLKKIYFYEWGIERYPDLNSSVLRRIFELDNLFIYEFLDFLLLEKYSSEILISGHMDLSFFWERDDYIDSFEQIVEYVYQEEHSKPYWIGPSFVEIFFHHLHSDEKGMTDEQKRRKLELRDRALIPLKALMHSWAADRDKASFVFQLVSNSFADQRKDFLEIFLAGNTSFEDFKHLDFESNHVIAVDAATRIPRLEHQIEFFKSILPLFSSADLVEHQLHIETRISCLQKDIVEQKKRDFAQLD